MVAPTTKIFLGKASKRVSQGMLEGYHDAQAALRQRGLLDDVKANLKLKATRLRNEDYVSLRFQDQKSRWGGHKYAMRLRRQGETPEQYLEDVLDKASNPTDIKGGMYKTAPHKFEAYRKGLAAPVNTELLGNLPAEVKVEFKRQSWLGSFFNVGRKKAVVTVPTEKGKKPIVHTLWKELGNREGMDQFVNRAYRYANVIHENKLANQGKVSAMGIQQQARVWGQQEQQNLERFEQRLQRTAEKYANNLDNAQAMVDIKHQRYQTNLGQSQIKMGEYFDALNTDRSRLVPGRNSVSFDDALRNANDRVAVQYESFAEQAARRASRVHEQLDGLSTPLQPSRSVSPSALPQQGLEEGLGTPRSRFGNGGGGTHALNRDVPPPPPSRPGMTRLADGTEMRAIEQTEAPELHLPSAGMWESRSPQADRTVTINSNPAYHSGEPETFSGQLQHTVQRTDDSLINPASGQNGRVPSWLQIGRTGVGLPSRQPVRTVHVVDERRFADSVAPPARVSPSVQSSGVPQGDGQATQRRSVTPPAQQQVQEPDASPFSAEALRGGQHGGQPYLPTRRTPSPQAGFVQANDQLGERHFVASRQPQTVIRGNGHLSTPVSESEEVDDLLAQAFDNESLQNASFLTSHQEPSVRETVWPQDAVSGQATRSGLLNAAKQEQQSPNQLGGSSPRVASWTQDSEPDLISFDEISWPPPPGQSPKASVLASVQGSPSAFRPVTKSTPSPTHSRSFGEEHVGNILPKLQSTSTFVPVTADPSVVMREHAMASRQVQPVDSNSSLIAELRRSPSPQQLEHHTRAQIPAGKRRLPTNRSAGDQNTASVLSEQQLPSSQWSLAPQLSDDASLPIGTGSPSPKTQVTMPSAPRQGGSVSPLDLDEASSHGSARSPRFSVTSPSTQAAKSHQEQSQISAGQARQLRQDNARFIQIGKELQLARMELKRLEEQLRQSRITGDSKIAEQVKQAQQRVQQLEQEYDALHQEMARIDALAQRQGSPKAAQQVERSASQAARSERDAKLAHHLQQLEQLQAENAKLVQDLQRAMQIQQGAEKAVKAGTHEPKVLEKAQKNVTSLQQQYDALQDAIGRQQEAIEGLNQPLRMVGSIDPKAQETQEGFGWQLFDAFMDGPRKSDSSWV